MILLRSLILLNCSFHLSVHTVLVLRTDYHHPPLNTRRCLLAKVDKPVADEAKMKLIWSLSTSFIVRRSAQELITPYVWTLTLQADYVSPLT